jgi:iron complex outermembrane receptor protein
MAFFRLGSSNKHQNEMGETVKLKNKAIIGSALMTVAATSAAQAVLEEVVVTAQKRAESVQDVPLTVNALSGEALKDFTVQNFADLEALAPGLDIDLTSGRSGAISMRGVIFDPNSAADAAVTVYLNDAIVDGNTVFQQLFDLERVEVLRGPQGTLQGRSSPAGAINLHTAKANVDTVEGQIKTTFQDNDGFNTQFGINLPVIEGVLGVRIAGIYDQSDKNEVENILTGDMSNEDTQAGRISVTWLPSDSITVNLMHQYLQNDNKSYYIHHGTPSGSAILDPNGILPTLDAFERKTASVGSDDTESEYSITTLAITWELENHTLTSVTGYHETDSVRDFDRAEGNADPGNLIQRVATDDREDFSQEIRFASSGDGDLEYMLGAYFEKSNVTFTQDNFIRVGHPFAPASQLLQFPAVIERSGIFAHGKYHFNEQWTAQLGLRWQNSDSERDITLVAGDVGFPTVSAPGDLILDVLADQNENYKTDAVTGSFSLQYNMDESQVYANISTGWRPGAVTVTGATLPEEVLLFNDEDSLSFELGFKSELLDGALRLNAAAYFQEFDDYIYRVNTINARQLAADGTITGGITQGGLTTNADAEILGAEVQIEWLINENWFLGGGISYNDAKFKSGEVAACNQFNDDGSPAIPEGQAVALCDVGDERIGDQPNWSASMNSEYTLPMGDFEGYVRGLYQFTDSRANNEIGTQAAFSTTDLYLGMRSEQWDISVFARNLFDKEVVLDGIFATLPVRRQVTGYGRRQLLQSRLIGVSASYNF